MFTGCNDYTSQGAAALIKQNQGQREAVKQHEQIRNAVRAWSAVVTKDGVAAEVIEAWERRGRGGDFGFHASTSRNAQKIFRWLDSDSENAIAQIQALLPSILAVLPAVYRARLDLVDRWRVKAASAAREHTEALTAAMLGAPVAELEKEFRESIEATRLLASELGLSL